MIRSQRELVVVASTLITVFSCLPVQAQSGGYSFNLTFDLSGLTKGSFSVTGSVTPTSPPVTANMQPCTGACAPNPPAPPSPKPPSPQLGGDAWPLLSHMQGLLQTASQKEGFLDYSKVDDWIENDMNTYDNMHDASAQSQANSDALRGMAHSYAQYLNSQLQSK